jgi:hypothetical protein
VGQRPPRPDDQGHLAVVCLDEFNAQSVGLVDSAGGRQLISSLEGAISGLGEQQRNRMDLSLQWFFRAEETHQGVDGSLMYWFALKSLAMPGFEKIAAIEARLAKIYQLNRAFVRDSFRLGKLYGLRGDIVHHGYHPPIDARVLDFMAAVYWDLLLDTLKLAPYRAAGDFLAAHDIDDWFPTLQKKSVARRPASGA